MPDLTINIEYLPEIRKAVDVRLTGWGDAKTVPAFQECMNALWDSGYRYFVLDLENLRAFSETFDGYAVNLADRLDPVGGAIVLLRAQPKVAVVLDMLGLWAFFRRAESRAEAIEIVRRMADG
ncbi:MAG: STAS domain-containing protein [Planctomycetes bacterium]|nr:STAS domain-containing protein [Planctomycetota bacterium]